MQSDFHSPHPLSGVNLARPDNLLTVSLATARYERQSGATQSVESAQLLSLNNIFFARSRSELHLFIFEDAKMHKPPPVRRAPQIGHVFTIVSNDRAVRRCCHRLGVSPGIRHQ